MVNLLHKKQYFRLEATFQQNKVFCLLFLDAYWIVQMQDRRNFAISTTTEKQQKFPKNNKIKSEK